MFAETTLQERQEKEEQLLDRARNYWHEVSREDDASDLRKLKAYSLEGLVRGDFENRVMEQFFKRQGYWVDGITTLEQHKRKLQLRKLEFGKKIQAIHDGYLSDLSDLKAKVEAKQEKLSNVPNRIKKEYKVDVSTIKETALRDIKQLFEAFENGLKIEYQKVYDDMISDFETNKQKILLEALDALGKLQNLSKSKIETEIVNLGASLTAELSVLNAKENDDRLIQEYQEEIKKLNRELKSLEEKVEEYSEIPSMDTEYLENFTVKDLRKIAEENKIDLNSQMRKSDIIEVLKENGV
jgi:phage host-nuclease inhibitor protein Gam